MRIYLRRQAVLWILACMAAASFVVNAQSKELPRIFQAADVARVAYIEQLAQLKAGSSEQLEPVKNIDNYNIGISEDANKFVVVFLPKPRKGYLTRGGGAEYWIRKSDLSIEKTPGYK